MAPIFRRGMNKFDTVYHNLLKDILDNGVESSDRTGVGTVSVFGRQLRFNLKEGFPLITTKKMFFNGMVDELLWFISGSTNVEDLPERTKKWWTPWARPDGSLGKTYGYQMRRLKVDQLKSVVESIKKDPYSRRHIIALWNPEMTQDMQLPPCHGNHIQFYVRNNTLSCSMLQRSADCFIGLPVNIASYALLTHMVAQVCDLGVGELIININDAHIYKNHLEQVKEQLTRNSFNPPTLKLNEKIKDIDLFTNADIMVMDYKHQPAIKAEVAV